MKGLACSGLGRPPTNTPRCCWAAARHHCTTGITADTVPMCEGHTLDKAVTQAEIIRYLDILSGKKHEIYTSICISKKENDTIDFQEKTVKATLTFKDISAEEKTERIRFLNSIISETAEKQAQRYLGRREQVLIEGPSVRNPARLAGRTFNNKTTNIDCDPELHDQYIGKICDVEITIS